MTTVNNCFLNLPLDQLPLEIRSDALWPYVITNGDRSAASQVCKAFLEADGYRLLGESNKILCEAQNNSGLYSSIKKRVVAPLETRESLYQFHEFMVSKIKVLGGVEIAVAHRPLTAEEVRMVHTELQDRALEKIWPDICTAVSRLRLGLALDRKWKASEVRLWMKENPEVVLAIQGLYFINCRLTMLPVEIGQFRNLTHLDAFYNKISELPVELGQLVKLNELNVSENQLKELPVELGQLTELINLRVSENQLGELPEEICQLKNLTYLNVSFNPLRKLPAEIERRENLTIESAATPYDRSKKIDREFRHSLIFNLPIIILSVMVYLLVGYYDHL